MNSIITSTTARISYILYMTILLVGFGFCNYSFGQTLDCTSASGSGSTNSSTFSTVAGASVTIDVTGVNSILVVSTFQTEMTSPGTDIREASFRIVDNDDPENINSGIIRRSLSNAKSTDYGIGSVVYIFDVSAFSGNRTYEFQHSFSTSARTVTTNPTIVAVALTDGTDQLKYDVKRVSTPSIMSTNWETVSGSETDFITTTSSGGFYVAASVESMTSSFNTESIAQWKLQYKKGSDGTWGDLNTAVQRMMLNSNDRGIINLVGMLRDSTAAGDYYFRIAHRRTSASSTINTEAANIVAVSLSTTSGSFSIFKLTGTGVTTTSSILSDAISTKVSPSINTGLILHAQYTMSADAETNSSMYDIYVDNSILDGDNQKRYISSDTDKGSGASIAATSELMAGTEYNVSLRHASASSNTLTSNDMSLIGFGLTINSGPLPIELQYLRAKHVEELGVVINWATISETNNDYFTLYRSDDCSNWIEIGKIMGAGNSNEVLNYEFIDTEPTHDETYYKLTQTDYNGVTAEADIVSVYCKLNLKNIIVFPNPTSDYIYFNFNNKHQTEKPLEVLIYNYSEQICYKQNFICNKDENSFKIILPNNLRSGLYLLRAKIGDNYLYSAQINIIR